MKVSVVEKQICNRLGLSTLLAAGAMFVLPSTCTADGEVPLSPSESGYYSEFSQQKKTGGAVVNAAKPGSSKNTASQGGAAGSGDAGATAIVAVPSGPPTIAQARGERLSAAVGHYARSRSLLLAAIREFDRGMEKADASPLLDVEAWRNNLITRAEELETVLDPQPRSSRTGVKYEADTRLLGEPTP